MVVGFPKSLRNEGLIEDDFIVAYTLDPLIVGTTDLDDVAITFADINTGLSTSVKDVAFEAVVQNSDASEWCVDCKRSLLYDRKFVNSIGDSGRVAYRDELYIHPNYRRRGIASAVLQQEEVGIFRKWNAVEVQALAAFDGPLVWTRPIYGYEAFPDDLLLLRLAYEMDWSHGQKDSSQINSIHDFPDDFWQYFWAQDRQFQIYKRLT